MLPAHVDSAAVESELRELVDEFDDLDAVEEVMGRVFSAITNRLVERFELSADQREELLARLSWSVVLES